MSKKKLKEKSKRLNFNAAISLTFRGVFGLSYGEVCPVCVCVCVYTVHPVFNEFDIALDAWQTCRLVIDVSSFSWKHKILFSSFFFLKPFYKCLQCCVICNWIRECNMKVEAVLSWGQVNRRNEKNLDWSRKGGNHGLTEKFSWWLIRA